VNERSIVSSEDWDHLSGILSTPIDGEQEQSVSAFRPRRQCSFPHVLAVPSLIPAAAAAAACVFSVHSFRLINRTCRCDTLGAARVEASGGTTVLVTPGACCYARFTSTRFECLKPSAG
jgi:hypothetical protein